MGQRASRVLQQESTRPQRSTTSSGAKTLPSAKLEHMWHRLIILLKMFLRFTQIKDFLLTIMPSETINPTEDEDDFEKIDVEGDTSDRPKSKENKKAKPWRILTFKGEKFVVGNQLEAGKGTKDKQKHTHDPIVCQHPSGQMFGRGGKDDKKWWTCVACGGRWDRVPLAYYELTSAPKCRDILTFGKHAGQTFDWAYLNDMAYCQWIMMTMESGDSSCPQLKKFARYLATREARDPGDIPAGRMDEEL